MNITLSIDVSSTSVRIHVPQASLNLNLANVVAIYDGDSVEPLPQGTRDILGRGKRLVEIGMTLEEIKRVALPEMWARYGARTIIWKWFDEDDFNPQVAATGLQWYSRKIAGKLPRPKALNLISTFIDCFTYDIRFAAWTHIRPEQQKEFKNHLRADNAPVNALKVVSVTMNRELLYKKGWF